LTSPQPKYWGGCVPGIPGGVDSSGGSLCEFPYTQCRTRGSLRVPKTSSIRPVVSIQYRLVINIIIGLQADGPSNGQIQVMTTDSIYRAVKIPFRTKRLAASR